MNQIPKAKKDGDFKEVLHGKTIHDPYRWLEGDGKDVHDWIAAENRYSESFLANLPIRKKIAKRMQQVLKIDAIGTPVPRNGLYFSMHRKKNQDLSVLYVSRGLRGKKRVLIDQSKLSKDKTAVLSRWKPSPDGKFLAYAISEQANDQNAIYVMDVLTGKKLKDHIPADLYPAMHSGITWHPDASGFWYERRGDNAPKGEEKLHQKLYWHSLGDDFKKDVLVFGKGLDKEAGIGATISSDGRWLLVRARVAPKGIRKDELYLKDLTKPNSSFAKIVAGVDAYFGAWIHRGILYATTNYRAPRWRCISIPVEEATKGLGAWRVVIPEGKNILKGVLSVSDRLFVETLENVHAALSMHDLSGKFISEIVLPPLGSVLGFDGEREGSEIFISYSSFTVPFSVYRFDLASDRLALFDRTKVAVDFKNLTAKQVWFRSKDGTKVPMFIVHKKGMALNGKNPVLLNAYGGFGISETPYFNSLRTTFLELGGVYVLPNIRGGGEFGEEWHKGGAKANKQNVFDDFAAAGEWLIKNHYTDRGHLAAFGWSNGGLLMGAMLTQHPDMFKAIVVGAPVVDMLRFHKFHGGRHWIAEYGSPDDPKAFRYILKYSPYHNIKSGTAYPATLVVTAEGDDRVHPLHAYKFTARLQEANSSPNPILLRVEGKAGHSGAASVSKTVKQYSDIYGFVAWQLGMKA